MKKNAHSIEHFTWYVLSIRLKTLAAKFMQNNQKNRKVRHDNFAPCHSHLSHPASLNPRF